MNEIFHINILSAKEISQNKIYHQLSINEYNYLLTHKTNRKSNKHKTSPQLEQCDINAIRDFFSNTKRVKAQLKKLNTILTNLAKKLGFYDDKSHSLKGFVTHLPYKDKKLLSGYFTQWTQKNGFTTVFKSGVPT